MEEMKRNRGSHTQTSRAQLGLPEGEGATANFVAQMISEAQPTSVTRIDRSAAMCLDSKGIMLEVRRLNRKLMLLTSGERMVA